MGLVRVQDDRLVFEGDAPADGAYPAFSGSANDVIWRQPAADQVAFTYACQNLAGGETVGFYPLAKGQLLLVGFFQVVQPSDAGSTGQISFGGPDGSVFRSAFTPSLSNYAGGQIDTGGFLSSNLAIVPTGGGTTLIWTPGATPGNTPPVVRFVLATGPLFGFQD